MYHTTILITHPRTISLLTLAYYYYSVNISIKIADILNNEWVEGVLVRSSALVQAPRDVSLYMSM